jgi:hypothetical protein
MSGEDLGRRSIAEALARLRVQLMGEVDELLLGDD